MDKMEFWVQAATIVGVIVAIGLPLGKMIHNALTRDILDEIKKIKADVRSDMRSLKQEVITVGRDQKKTEIETRGNRARSTALADFLQEALMNQELARKLNRNFQKIDAQVDQNLEIADNEFQEKKEEIMREQRTEDLEGKK